MPCRTIGNVESVCWRLAGRTKEAFVPREGWVEIIDEILGEGVSVTSGERIEGLRRHCVKNRIDRVSVSGLHPGVSLKSEPSGVVFVDVVVNANRLHLFMIVTGMGDALSVGTAVAVVGYSRTRTTRVKGTAKNW